MTGFILLITGVEVALTQSVDLVSGTEGTTNDATLSMK